MLVLGASAHIRAGLNAPHRPVASLTGHLTKGPLLPALVGEVSLVVMKKKGSLVFVKKTGCYSLLSINSMNDDDNSDEE